MDDGLDMERKDDFQALKNVYEKETHAVSARKSISIRNFRDDIEIYQLIGGVGIFLTLVGYFLPVYEVKFYHTSEVVFYNTIHGKIMLVFLALSFILMITSCYKYSIIPTLIMLTYNLSIKMGLSKIYGYFKLGYGYQLVMLGVSIMLFSALLINTGYAKDSAFRHNAPLMKKDIIWILVAIAVALIISTVIRVDSNVDEFYYMIQKYKDAGKVLG